MCRRPRAPRVLALRTAVLGGAAMPRGRDPAPDIRQPRQPKRTSNTVHGHWAAGEPSQSFVAGGHSARGGLARGPHVGPLRPGLSGQEFAGETASPRLRPSRPSFSACSRRGQSSDEEDGEPASGSPLSIGRLHRRGVPGGYPPGKARRPRSASPRSGSPEVLRRTLFRFLRL